MGLRARGQWLALWVPLGLMFAPGCETEPRRVASLSEATPEPLPAAGNIYYRYVGVEQSLNEARRALEAEKWGEALIAARRLLHREPTHAGAQRIVERAERETGSAAAYGALKKAGAARDLAAVLGQFKKIPADSVYLERARAIYERLRDPWLAARESEARLATQRGRCREARH